MTVMASTEITATQQDAEQRITELKAVARRLWPDRDDAQVMSELVSVVSQIRAAEEELTDRVNGARSQANAA